MKTLYDIGSEFNKHSGCALNPVAGAQRALEEMGEALIEAGKLELLGDQRTLEEADEQALAIELADVVITLASLAAHNGIDLDAAIASKHQINLLREWQPHGSIPGGVKRVKQGGR